MLSMETQERTAKRLPKYSWVVINKPVGLREVKFMCGETLRGVRNRFLSRLQFNNNPVNVHQL